MNLQFNAHQHHGPISIEGRVPLSSWVGKLQGMERESMQAQSENPLVML